MSQKIIVTTSPWKDHARNKWMLSCFFSIQLDAGKNTKLSEFPDILDWINRIRNADFFVQWNSNLPNPVEPLSDRWDADLYAKLFHADINVKTFAPLDVSSIRIKSYPVKYISEFILKTYRDVGNLRIDQVPTARFYRTEFKGLTDVAQVKVRNDRPQTGTNREAKINDFVAKEHTGKKTAGEQLNRNRSIAFAQSANPTLDFGQFFNFHTKFDKEKIRRIVDPEKPDFEYHDILSILTSYPVILKKVGLIVDFELPSPPPASGGKVRILPTNLDFDKEVQVSSPATAFQYTGRGFYAAPKPGSFIDRGMLKINNSEFDVIQIDSDGTALKLASHADSLNMDIGRKLVRKSNYVMPQVEFKRFNADPARRAQPPAGTQPARQEDEDDDDDDKEEGLPPIRSAGIGIIRNGLANIMLQKLMRNMDVFRSMVSTAALLNSSALMNNVPAANRTQPRQPQKLTADARRELSRQRMPELTATMRQPQLIPAPTETLYADDIVFGYRLDVAYEDKPNEWYSLHKRKNSYSFMPVGGAEERISLRPEEEIDEGCIHLSLTEDENDDTDEKKLNEVIARWEGWSLSVPRLGKGINNRGVEVSSDQEEAKKHRMDPSSPFRLEAVMKPAPRSLPRLRFGWRYRVKIRTVDICGNGLPHDAQPEDAGLAVKGGIEYRRYEPLPAPVLWQGDEVVGGDRKKMRERDGESLEHLVIRSNADIATREYERNNITTITENGKKLGTLEYLHEAVRFVTAPRTSQQMAEVHGLFDEAFRDPSKAGELYAFINSRDKETVNDGTTKARVIPVETGQLDIDYLADPMAAGVIFTMKSETGFETPWRKGESFKFSFHFDEPVTDGNANRRASLEEWKNPRSIKVRLIEGQGAPAWNGRVFTIQLQKSAIVEVNFACFWRPDELNRLSGLYNAVDGGQQSVKATQFAKKGQHWMFSPWRTLRLVHAVQQPLRKPQFTPAVTLVSRQYEATYVNIVTLINLHGASTDKVDIGAEWKEWADDLSLPAPVERSYKNHVATIPVLYNDNRLELVRLAANAPANPELLPPLRHAFNDTRHRKVRYTPVAASRFREYFTGIIETERLKGGQLPLSVTGDPVEINILSSARPGLPMVDYVLPSFNWTRSDNRPTSTHVRTGNIRVYLKRPWYSSGDGEMLGVILPERGADASNDAVLKESCTVWGVDPVFDAGALNGRNYPSQEHFPNAAEYDTVRLAEDPGKSVVVAGYPVRYDTEKQLHYADIPVTIAQAYFPFVRLSLARYQKDSLRINGRDCCLSGIVKADWMQVVPSRIVTLRESNNSNQYEIGVAGPAPFRNNPDGFDRDNARVRINISIDTADTEKTDGAFIRINEAEGMKTTFFNRNFDIKTNDTRDGAINFRETIRFDQKFAGKPMRIVVREYELHERDPLRNPPARSGNAAERGYDERLVFMDVFELPVNR